MTAKQRLFIQPDQIAGDTIRLDAAQAHQLFRVLRLRPNDAITILDGTGRAAEARIAALDARSGQAVVAGWQAAPEEPLCRLTLFQALIKQDRFEWVVQKGTEIGVAAFVPVVTERCVVREPGPNRLTRWRSIAREAAEQSGRGRIPDVRDPVALEDIAVAGPDPFIVCWEGESSARLRDVAPTPRSPLHGPTSLLIGPEGGLTEAEVRLLRDRGALVCSLGQRILRAETAGPVAATVLLFLAGDIG